MASLRNPVGRPSRRSRRQPRRQHGLRGTVRSRRRHLRLGHGAVPLVSRTGRHLPGSARPGCRRPSDADLRVCALPLAAADRRLPNGLTDRDGFMWRDVAEARLADAARRRSRTAGPDRDGAGRRHRRHAISMPHMGTAWQPEFVDIYLRLVEQFRLPVHAVARRPRPGATGLRLHARISTACRPAAIPTSSASSRRPSAISRRMPPPMPAFSTARPAGSTGAAFHFAAAGRHRDAIPTTRPCASAEYDIFRSGRAQELLDAPASSSSACAVSATPCEA